MRERDRELDDQRDADRARERKRQRELDDQREADRAREQRARAQRDAEQRAREQRERENYNRSRDFMIQCKSGCDPISNCPARGSVIEPVRYVCINKISRCTTSCYRKCREKFAPDPVHRNNLKNACGELYYIS